MMKPILGANHRSTKIEIVLPVDKDGDYAYDEDGDPIKGKTPVVFSIPRFDCMPRDTFKEVKKQWNAIEDMKNDDGEPLTAEERGIEYVIAMVKPFVDPQVLAVVEKLHLFELEQIAERIQEGSKITVGELAASTSS